MSLKCPLGLVERSVGSPVAEVVQSLLPSMEELFLRPLLMEVVVPKVVPIVAVAAAAAFRGVVNDESALRAAPFVCFSSLTLASMKVNEAALSSSKLSMCCLDNDLHNSCGQVACT